MREAMEYLELYYHERNEDMCGEKGFLPKRERMAQVRKAINETGTYVHTFDELGESDSSRDERFFHIYSMYCHSLYFIRARRSSSMEECPQMQQSEVLATAEAS